MIGTPPATAYDTQSRALFVCGGIGQPCHFIDADGSLDIELFANEGVDYVSIVSSSDFVASVPPLDAAMGESQIVWMPELREFRGPGRWLSQGRSEDDAIRMLQGPDAIYRLDADTDEPMLVRQGQGYATVFGNRIWPEDAVDGTPTVSSRPSKLRFVRMLMDGSNVEDLLGHEVTNVTQLDRDRWIYTTELDARDLGELEAVDLVTGERETLLDFVMPQATASRSSAFVDDEPNDALVHRITPDDPEGNGVWWVHTDRLFR